MTSHENKEYGTLHSLKNFIQLIYIIKQSEHVQFEDLFLFEDVLKTSLRSLPVNSNYLPNNLLNKYANYDSARDDVVPLRFINMPMPMYLLF